MEVSLFAVIYRITIVIIGLFITYLGYLLFKSNISNQSGDLEVTFKKLNFALKNSTPGTLLTILGIVVILSGYGLKIPTYDINEITKKQNDSIKSQIGIEMTKIASVRDSLLSTGDKKYKKYIVKIDSSSTNINSLVSKMSKYPFKSKEVSSSGPKNMVNDSTISKLPNDTLKHD